jgi:hypothetical protein
MLRSILKKANYHRSNAITKIKFKPSDFAKDLTQKILQSSSAEERQRLSDDLLDELADLAGIDIVKLEISDEKQHHRRRGGKISMRQYGYYKPDKKYIYITNRTAARGQILAPKSFLNTLLHEWIHHYDFCKLKINSIHSKGFYARLKDLSQKLIDG